MDTLKSYTHSYTQIINTKQINEDVYYLYGISVCNKCTLDFKRSNITVFQVY